MTLRETVLKNLASSSQVIDRSKTASTAVRFESVVRNVRTMDSKSNVRRVKVSVWDTSAHVRALRLLQQCCR
jgi:hypothetical protein